MRSTGLLYIWESVLSMHGGWTPNIQQKHHTEHLTETRKHASKHATHTAHLWYNFYDSKNDLLPRMIDVQNYSKEMRN